MNIYDTAKELTIAAIQNNLLDLASDDKSTYKAMAEGTAENVATFYNRLIEKLKVNKE